jgi:hypothetical protein
MLFEETGHRPGRARAFNNVGWYHALLGDHHQALLRSKQAYRLSRQRRKLQRPRRRQPAVSRLA